MSNPAILWSKIGQKRGAHPVSPELEKKPSEPTPAQAGAPRKTGRSLVFKASPKGLGPKVLANASTVHGSAYSWTPSTATSSVTPISTTLWSDYSEDECYDIDQKSQENKSIVSTTARQAKRLEEAEAAVDQHAQRVVELNSQIKTRASRIEELEVAIKKKTARVVELEAVTTDQDARIVHLVHRADEEARRVVQLEEELQKKTAVIQKLELQIAETFSMPYSDSATEVEIGDEKVALPQSKPDTIPLVVGPETLDAPINFPDTTTGFKNEIPEKLAKSQVESPVSDEFSALSPAEFPTLGSPTPVRDLRRSPFVTAENIKKMPPPPPARTLKFAIDTSKYQKKPARGSEKIVFSSRRVTEGPPKFDVNKDIRVMSREEREPFGHGPTIHVVMGNETVAALPKYIFMQVSYKALKHWSDTPTATTIKFETGSMSKNALNIVLDWMTTHTYCKFVFSVALKEESSDRHNLEIVRCARVLGLHPMYVSQFTRKYCERVRDGPSKKLVALIEELTFNTEDTIFDCLANYMAMERSKVKSEDLGTWDEELVRLPKLAQKTHDIHAKKNFVLGKTRAKVKKGLPPTIAAEKISTTTVTAEAAIDPDAAWRTTGPAYI